MARRHAMVFFEAFPREAYHFRLKTPMGLPMGSFVVHTDRMEPPLGRTLFPLDPVEF